MQRALTPWPPAPMPGTKPLGGGSTMNAMTEPLKGLLFGLLAWGLKEESCLSDIWSRGDHRQISTASDPEDLVQLDIQALGDQVQRQKGARSSWHRPRLQLPANRNLPHATSMTSLRGRIIEGKLQIGQHPPKNEAPLHQSRRLSLTCPLFLNNNVQVMTEFT
jgi:hypothetical protein